MEVKFIKNNNLNLFNIMALSDIIGILTCIASCVAIVVALCQGRRSSKDCKRMITSHKEDTDSQIKEIRIASENEIKEFNTLIHTLLASTIHYLDNENIILTVSANEANHKYFEILSRYENLKAWKLEKTDTISIDEINNHFTEMNLLEESMLELKANYECYQRSADNIKVLLNHFLSLDNQLCSNKVNQ